MCLFHLKSNLFSLPQWVNTYFSHMINLSRKSHSLYILTFQNANVSFYFLRYPDRFQPGTFIINILCKFVNKYFFARKNAEIYTHEISIYISKIINAAINSIFTKIKLIKIKTTKYVLKSYKNIMLEQFP